MKKQTILKVLAGVALLGLIAAGNAGASGITVYKDGDKYVKMGGRIHLQYHQVDPDEGDSTDEVFFRRFRPYIEGSLHKNWKGKFQWDMGKAEGSNEIAVKDAYFQYTGVKDLKVTVGNAYFPFSREDMTSSNKQQLVERTFVGDHDFGSPERNAGVFLHYALLDKKLELHAAGASASIDPDVAKLDFDTPINRDADFNEGWIFGGRVDFHPLGYLAMGQGDFERELKATISVAAFTWNNDDDNNTFTDEATGLSTSASKADVDTVTGFEISGALRGYGFSVDAQYNLFNAESIDDTFTGGIYEDGETDLENWAVEGGYMVIPSKLELVAGYEWQDADNYAEEWTRTSVGANYFFKKHDIKLQATYRMGENLKGADGVDEDEVFVQAQYVF
ncbi:porin [Desulfuromonas sp. TF]|uniref:porin n=1 Tax=Desulfuromonas sp. TF TaxID=1232410 RepID=UPI0004020559|nr:porin [Desulfuromonas sp. TF]